MKLITKFSDIIITKGKSLIFSFIINKSIQDKNIRINIKTYFLLWANCYRCEIYEYNKYLWYVESKNKEIFLERIKWYIKEYYKLNKLSIIKEEEEKKKIITQTSLFD